MREGETFNSLGGALPEIATGCEIAKPCQNKCQNRGRVLEPCPHGSFAGKSVFLESFLSLNCHRRMVTNRKTVVPSSTLHRGTSSSNLFGFANPRDVRYTGQKKVALVDVETHDDPIPLESYTLRQGKVWAVICHPGKPFININLKRCDN